MPAGAYGNDRVQTELEVQVSSIELKHQFPFLRMCLPHQIPFLQYLPPEYFSALNTRSELSIYTLHLLSASELSPKDALQVNLLPFSDRILKVSLPM